MSVMSDKLAICPCCVEAELLCEWLKLRDDNYRLMPCAVACVQFARRVGLLNDEQEELWLRRLDMCPGHDDEGGRDWCAYCGDLPKEDEDD